LRPGVTAPPRTFLQSDKINDQSRDERSAGAVTRLGVLDTSGWWRESRRFRG
jgi:hypothetical protein